MATFIAAVNRDPGLPLLSAATMIATQYLTPTTGLDPVQVNDESHAGRVLWHRTARPHHAVGSKSENAEPAALRIPLRTTRPRADPHEKPRQHDTALFTKMKCAQCL
jgi:hypothetical protein